MVNSSWFQEVLDRNIKDKHKNSKIEGKADLS